MVTVALNKGVMVSEMIMDAIPAIKPTPNKIHRFFQI
jgi:hypothetical protein